jgi:hypothetical protein
LIDTEILLRVVGRQILKFLHESLSDFSIRVGELSSKASQLQVREWHRDKLTSTIALFSGEDPPFSSMIDEMESNDEFLEWVVNGRLGEPLKLSIL